MQKIVIYLFLFFVSCNKMPVSIGKDNQIIIISSKADKSIISPLIMPLFETSINTPVEESIYAVNWVDPVDFNNYMKYKNILILSVDNPIDSTIDVLNNKFFDNTNINGVYSLYNLYASNQLIIPMKARDSVELYTLIENYRNWIVDEIDENIEKNIFYTYKLNKPNIDLSKLILNKYTLNLHVDENFTTIKNNDNFLWIGRGYPYRWLCFSIIDKIDFNKDNWNTYISNISNNIPGINISDFFRKEYEMEDYVVLTGIYDYDISDTGGPFFVYIFENYIDNKVILASGFVSNPGKDKFLLLKQLELIIKNNKGINYE